MILEPRSSFIGRRAELDSVATLLDSERLITLTGVGGVGKTRLAIRAANTYAEHHEVAPSLILLEAVEDPALLPLTVVRALRLTDQSVREPLEVIVEALADRDVLIVLDNCEHLIETVAEFVDRLLDTLPRLRILATSRRPLELVGEHIFAVPPLSIASDANHGSDALDLLIARAFASGAPGSFSSADEATALELCRSLDGLPLAIELAATRLRTLTVDELVTRLGSRFALLRNGPRTAVERQRTLRAVVDWSYELCDAEQRGLWAALSVLSGQFDLTAATAVADLPDTTVVNTLDQLVAQSIVEADHDTGRFRMLETIRGYGRERAREDGQWPGLLRRHLDHVRRTASQIRLSWWGPGQAEKLGRLRDEHAELQSALATAEASDADAALELFSDLRYHWAVGGFLREGRAWATRVLALEGVDPARRLIAIVQAAWLCLLQGDLAEASGLLSEADDLALSIDAEHADADTRLTATIELPRWRGSHAMFSGDPVAGQRYFESSIGAAAEAGLPAEALLAQFQLTTARSHMRRDDAAGPATEALHFAEEIGETWMRSHALWSLALAAFVKDDLDTSEDRAREGLMAERGFDDPIGICLMVEALGWVDARRGRNDRAAILLGAAASQWRRIGSDIAALGPQLTAHHTECATVVRQRLGARAETRLFDEGSRMSPQEIVAFALAPPPTGTLSARERDVASGVHRGLSNREIADELVLSVRTVDTHVQRIFAKLGVASRAQVAAWYESAGD